ARLEAIERALDAGSSARGPVGSLRRVPRACNHKCVRAVPIVADHLAGGRRQQIFEPRVLEERNGTRAGIAHGIHVRTAAPGIVEGLARGGREPATPVKRTRVGILRLVMERHDSGTNARKSLRKLTCEQLRAAGRYG